MKSEQERDLLGNLNLEKTRKNKWNDAKELRTILQKFSITLFLLELFIILFLYSRYAFIDPDNVKFVQVLNINIFSFLISILFLINQKFQLIKAKNQTLRINFIILNLMYSFLFQNLNFLLNYYLDKTLLMNITSIIEVSLRFMFIFSNQPYSYLNFINSLIHIFFNYFQYNYFYLNNKEFLNYSINLAIGNFFLCLFSLMRRQSFISDQKKLFSLKLQLLELMNLSKSGFISFSENEILENNIREILKFEMNNEELNNEHEEKLNLFIEKCLSRINLDSDNLPKSIKNYIQNVKLASTDQPYKKFDFRIFREISENHLNELKKFKLIGTLILENQKFNLFFRVNENDLEFFFDNLNDSQKIDKMQSEMKFKTHHLSKFIHDFKNPMLTIISMCQSLSFSNQEECFSPIISIKSQNEVLIQNLCNYLLSLIDDLNHFTSEYKIYHSDESKDVKEFDLVSTINFAINIFKIRLNNENSQKCIDIIGNYDYDLPNLYISETKLKQVLINLLSNSYKFTNRGRIELSLNKITKNEDNYLRFKVEDTGIGIPEKYLDCIFNLNEEIEFSRELNSHGSGLGLKIVKDIVENHFKSQINVSSEIGKGTKFWFDLKYDSQSQPVQNRFQRKYMNNVLKDTKKSDHTLNLDKTLIKLTSDLNDENCGEDSTEEFDKEFTFPFSTKINDNSIFGTKSHLNSTIFLNSKFTIKETKKIVICDDDDMIRKSMIKVIKKSAESFNFNPITLEAHNGLEAINLIVESRNSAPVNFLLIDETMPIMKGSVAINNLKIMMNENYISTLIICSVSAYIGEEHINFLTKQGADLVLCKPINEESLGKLFNL